MLLLLAQEGLNGIIRTRTSTLTSVLAEELGACQGDLSASKDFVGAYIDRQV